MLLDRGQEWSRTETVQSLFIKKNINACTWSFAVSLYSEAIFASAKVELQTKKDI